jgi:phosphopentomutase
MFKRVIWIIIDSVGIGAMPDAARFGDEGADTLGHINAYRGRLNVPNMEKLGLYSIKNTALYDEKVSPIGAFGKASELSNGKDTTTGHWEMAGIETKKAFPTYPDGFPEDVMEEFVKKTVLSGYLGNCVASGTTRINE